MTCQEITDNIVQIQKLFSEYQRNFDDRNFDEAMEKKKQIESLLGSYDLLLRLGAKGFSFLVKKFGSVEALKNRIQTLTIGGNTEEDLALRLGVTDNQGERIFNLIDTNENPDNRQYDDDEFRRRFSEVFTKRFSDKEGFIRRQREPGNIDFIILSVKDIEAKKSQIANLNMSLLGYVKERAEELGLKYSLPPETPIYQRLSDQNQAEGDNYEIMTDSDKGLGDWQFFYRLSSKRGLLLRCFGRGGHDPISDDLKIMFQIPAKKK